MASTTMHFGPEWMRTKQQTSTTRTQPHPPSPPPPASGTISGASTYSALVSPAPPPQPENRDETHPFRYSKYDLLRIYREGGGKGGLGLEVERWEGVVREVGSEPVSLREMGDAEKKVCVVVWKKNCRILGDISFFRVTL
jgi:PERQ amino acid-rich with GYF domain-containing protein